MTNHETDDPTAAIEVFARLLCTADIHVYGDEHPTWQKLSRKVQDDYRKAARWLLPRMTVATRSAAVSVPPPAPRADDRAAVAAPVKQRADLTELEWAEQERARFERLYTRETVRVDKAEARATAMEHAMESTAADALKHRGCHRDLMAQCLRAERAEAEAERLRTENERMRHELEVMYGGAFDSPKPAPADRAAVLREAADVIDRLRASLAPSTAHRYESGLGLAATELRRLADGSAVVPPPALTEEGRLRAQVEVLQQDAERDQGLAKVGARCMRDGHQGLIEQGRLVLEGWRFALSTALDLGTGAPWEAIHERAKELCPDAAVSGPVAGEQQNETPEANGCWCGHPKDRHWAGSTRMTFPDGCHDCRGWNGAHGYRQELPWLPEGDEPAVGVRQDGAQT